MLWGADNNTTETPALTDQNTQNVTCDTTPRGVSRW